MKKITFLLLIFLIFSTITYSQQQTKPYSDMFRPEFRIAVGVNAIQNLGTREPFTDFDVNANGTLNLLYLSKKYCQKSVFIYVSTNKVYGDLPNHLPLIEKKNVMR